MRIDKKTGLVEKALGKLPDKTARRIAFKTPLGRVIDDSRKVYVDGRKLDVPVFSNIKVPADYCARYVRLAAEQMFDKNYEVANAWGLGDVNRVVSQFEDSSMWQMADKGILQPGMVVGLEFPGSDYADRGRYSHVGLMIGVGSYGPLVAHKFHEQTRVDSPGEIEGLGLNPVEIIDSKN
ncbi:hypothetical protein COU62_01165 [Candidatus Pacearchaeota archaeon CG10_big_fil_rev_8_21_14_0_10_35_219]|nr:hypothetical protein [Candidatus Pacearchaeota archaeon]OIO43048.1 MAG: hypothetical protein AUJ63_01335 [Candidatus Pacearchaeota archaeon CG1_02_35_32]PIO08174.1 MAG: hypothetical protein COU62_01165 [Candidatus Pacearchaeota archaeon CG10_big_fil_rev_8_21_14_0_10_35_219]PIY81106.1 MAG: hypothetical protein COY79_04875 [Candidatus Pacearchaeota archaeon CG_4_10_14_0_8_um_filter_35_169]PIZ79755.1 MAG: hypothetical protein COY00_03410 [Candidatus Pacearchaeota archaeon CG_4_10_14_0_2_um_filt